MSAETTWSRLVLDAAHAVWCTQVRYDGKPDYASGFVIERQTNRLGTDEYRLMLPSALGGRGWGLVSGSLWQAQALAQRPLEELRALERDVIRDDARTNLRFAISRGQLARVKALLSADADLYALSSHPQGPCGPGNALCVAVRLRAAPVVEELLRHVPANAQETRELLGWALLDACGAQNAYPDAMAAASLIHAGAPAAWANPQGITPMHCAVAGADDPQRRRAVQILLKSGASPDGVPDGHDAAARSQATPFMLALEAGNHWAARTLADAGADLARLDPDGRTALDRARQAGVNLPEDLQQRMAAALRDAEIQALELSEPLEAQSPPGA